ncbi:hypothetical protein PHMEG_0005631, partial [Phytophthora megakarya]
MDFSKTLSATKYHYHVGPKIDPPSPLTMAGRYPRALTAEDNGDGILYKGISSLVVKDLKGDRGRHEFQRKPPHIDMADGILYKGSSSLVVKDLKGDRGREFQRKPPHIDMAREYTAAKSYKAARTTVVTLNERHRQLQIAQEEAFEREQHDRKFTATTVVTLNERHRQLQIAQEEAFERDQHDRKFTANFAEMRLATCGIPTLNTMNVRIERQREQAKTKDMTPTKPVTNKKLREAAHRENLATQVRDAVRRSYGSQELDLKSLELVHIPRPAVFTTLLLQFARLIRTVNVSRNELDLKSLELVHIPRPAIFTTLLLQFARLIRTVNVSRNALREIPESFIQAFPEVETLIFKENALARLPFRALGELHYLRVLNISGNQLDALPLHLPDTLETFDASRNRLHDIQNLHVLTRLITLDLSYNHFQLLPCGLVALHKLQTLTLAGNRLVTLATRPQLTRKRDTGANPQDDEDTEPTKEPTEEESEAERKQWRLEVDPITHDTVYFHLASKRVTRAKPKCFQVRIPKLQLPGNQVPPQNQGNRSVLDRYPEGWEIILPSASDTSTALQFVNHCTGENFSTLPPALDRWDDVDFLRLLVLSGNELLDLPPSMGKLKRLKRLEAENNKLLALPDVLQGLEALETVKLGMNGLSALPPSFTKLKNLIDVDVKLNRLRELPEALGDLQQLQVLDASANALEKLPRSFLALKRIVTLRLSGNTPLLDAGFAAETLLTGNLAEIRWQLEHQIECEKHGGSRPPEPRSRLIGVGAECWSTDLHINREFARAVEFAQETHTLSLHWRGIEVPELPLVFFRSIPNLRELRMSGQNFEILPAGFGTFTKLRLLQLRQNGIRVITPEVFGSNTEENSTASNLGIGTSLESLDLRYNRLETLPDTFTNCKKLQVLRASHNIITSLPESLDGLANSLVDVQLAHNQRMSGQNFEILPAGFGTFTKLRLLQLRQNGIRVITPEVFGSNTEENSTASNLGIGTSLESLDLRYNRLETLPDTFTNCKKLQVLRASHNIITSLPQSLDGLANSLVDVQLAHNQLANGPKALTALRSLERLDLSFNHIDSLDELDFSQLHHLQVLRLSGNRLTELPLSLGGVGTSDGGQPPPIRELSFAGNMLQEFPPAVLLLGATLQRLEMQSNRFERLPMSFGAALPALEIVESDGNPFRSPPAEVMRLGAQAIRQYLHKREQRVEELVALLSALGLVFDRETFDKPIMRNLLPPDVPLTSLPFLTAKHLVAFDRAVDRYVNGAFYLPPPPLGTGPLFHRGVDIFHKMLLNAHFELAQLHHRTVLEELLELLELIRQKRWADKTDLRYDMLRPWGRRGEQVGVYMVRGSLLFPNDYKADDDVIRAPPSPGKELPTVLQVIETRTKRGFPPVPFVENNRTLRDVEHALEQYVGFFGPVGVAHANVPMR